jgi:tetratricopeptide (TPR) repeat protein
VNTSDLRTEATATADAPIDSLPFLIDRVATLLVADAAGAGEEVERMPRLSPQGLRAYLTGRAAYTRGNLREAQDQFTRALENDSTFAAAAVGSALAADWLDDARSRTSALDLARSRSQSLSNSGQQQLSAILGPRFPSPLTGTEYVTGWERVASGGAQRAEPWIELGHRLLADGRLAGVTNSLERARAAFRRALALDSASAPAREALLAVALIERDPDALLLASSATDTSDASLALSWRVAVVQGNASLLATVRGRLPGASDDALRRIALDALYDGTHLDDGERAIEVRQSRSSGAAIRTDAILARHAFALTGGRPAEALEATRLLAREPLSDGAQLRLQVLDALYAEGDTMAAINAVERLSARTAEGLDALPDERSVRLGDLCVLEQWRIWRGDFSSVAATVRALSRGEATRYAAPVLSSSRACAIVLEAVAAGLRDAPIAEDALDRAERLALVGPTAGDLRHYATLALARVRERRGQLDRASELVRRRSTARGWPRYLASYLEMEARLAEKVSDTARARSALRHYLALRTRPEPPTRGVVDSLRALLRRIEEG